MTSTSRGWSKFSDSPLNSWLKKHLASVNIERPSPIQLQLMKAIMSLDGKRVKRNVFGCSPTGTGKTLSYVLPILHFLTQDIRPYYALILAPTRELAFQIYEIIKVLTGSTAKDGSSTMIKTLLMIGGGKTGLQSSETEIQGFWVGKPNIVVATPGRMVEQLTKRNYSEHTGHKSALRFDFLVLDEADLLIGPTFANQLKEILEAIDEHGGGHNRQTLVLSATLTSALEQLQRMFSDDKCDDTLKPVTINLLPTIEEEKLEISSNPNLDQRYVLCPDAMKPAYLIQVLSDISFKQTIVFCSSNRKAMLLHRLMVNLGFDEAEVACHPVLLASTADQKQRFKALEKFKSLKSRIMIATGGLAGRGLDLPQVDMVIQYDCPKPVEYIHRVGRTCRKIDFARIDEIEKIRANVRALRLRRSKTDAEQEKSKQAAADQTMTAADKTVRTESRDGEEEQRDLSSQDHDVNETETNCEKQRDNGLTIGTEGDERSRRDRSSDKLPASKLSNDNNEEVKEHEITREIVEQLGPKTKRSKMSKAATKYYGKAILFVTQYDIELLKDIEKSVNIRLTEEDELDVDNVPNILKPVAIALKDAELALIEESNAMNEKRQR